MVTHSKRAETCCPIQIFAELRPIVSRLDGSALPRPDFLSHLSIEAPQAIHFFRNMTNEEMRPRVLGWARHLCNSGLVD